MTTRGMVLGKFMPPHRGHEYLCRFAAGVVDELTVVVCSLPTEPIAGELRWAWMRELVPKARVVHLSEVLPQTPEEHPEFWALWEAALRRVLPEAPDVVFASEAYGAPLAARFGARFVPADPARDITPTSGTAVRADPLGQWEHLPEAVRAHYAVRVCVFGPESTGKTTLARRLAERFGTVWVPEYARTYLEHRDAPLGEGDMAWIGRGQGASEDALARRCERLLVCDTDVLTTAIWSEVLFGRVDPALARMAEARAADLYLLCDVDVPWVADPVRFLPEARAEFFARCEEALGRRDRPYVVIRGGWEPRWEAAVEAVEALMRARRPVELSP